MGKLLEPFGVTDDASAVGAGLGGTSPEDFQGGELKLDGFFLSRDCERDRSISELSHALLVRLNPILPPKHLPGQCWCELLSREGHAQARTSQRGEAGLGARSDSLALSEVLLGSESSFQSSSHTKSHV